MCIARYGLSLLFLLSMLQSGAIAGVLYASLTGDPRTANPDDLRVDVTVNFSGDTASWTVDINSPLHPDVKLDQFAFNIASPPFPNVTVANISPNNSSGQVWQFNQSQTLAGSGGISFNLLSDLGGSGNPHNNQVDNSTNLTFDLIRTSGSWVEDDFLLAPNSVSNDTILGFGQLGAHLQSLVAGPGESDSGVALGNYFVQRDPPAPRHIAPEPSSLTIFGLGAIGMAYVIRRRRKMA